MTPDGRFRDPPRVPVSTRLVMWAVLVAVLAGALAFAALALWLVAAMIPVVIVAALVAVGTLRFKAWQARRSLGGGRELRPNPFRRP